MAGRERDMIVARPGSGWGLDPLAYDLDRGRSPQAAARMLAALMDGEERGAGTGNARDPFWKSYATRAVEKAIAAVFQSEGKACLDDVQRFVASLPDTPAMFESTRWKADTFAGRIVTKLDQTPMPAAQRADFKQVFDFVAEWSETADATKRSLKPTIGGMLGRLMAEDVGAFTRLSTLPPDLAMSGKIVVLDYPVLTYKEPGKSLQLLYKMCFCRAVLRRSGEGVRPVVQWSDEAAHLLIQGHDALVQSVSRQAKLVNVFAFQDVQLARRELGSGEDAARELDSLANNCMTWIVHASSDTTSCQLIADRIGKVKEPLYGGSLQSQPFDLTSYWLGQNPPAVHVSFQEHYEHAVKPSDLAKFRKGAARNRFVTDSLVLTNGDPWSNGRTWLLTEWRQLL
jgi:hypothetical protein